MEETSIIISGFGGQGTLFAGQVLAYASMDNGLEVTWIPSYGPEMRGGTAHCTVIVSAEPIGSPLVRRPDVVVALNLPSVDKYEPLIKAGGVMVANSTLVNREITREGINSLLIPANTIAEELGMVRLSNMIMMGAMLALKPILPLEAVKKALGEHIPERHKKTLPLNYEAMDRGYQFAVDHQ
ncbi:MAG TPA: 2-oxoacid:ferredoxin oxidoreductase subunit gamma [Chloroflexi bacterium]|nr:MAG: 2-oxoacid:ferredoxin oxidoreductase subunit gamma [Chloroflexota bacterium]HDD55462.1 2-oxoacid:ferredoxin oxidoreductase subunit gamma [Chloroflexota bacterium]